MPQAGERPLPRPSPSGIVRRHLAAETLQVVMRPSKHGARTLEEPRKAVFFQNAGEERSGAEMLQLRVRRLGLHLAPARC